VSTAVGSGFICGAIIGGVISDWNRSLPCYAAAVIFLTNIFLVYFFLEEPAHKKPASIPGPSFSPLFTELKTNDVLRYYVILQFVIAMAFHTAESSMSLFVQMKFNFDPKANGFLLGFNSLSAVFVQSVLIRYLTSIVRDEDLIKYATTIVSFSMIGTGLIAEWQFLLPFLFMNVASHNIIGTCITSFITKSTPRDKIGVIMGMNGSLEGICRALAPFISGFLLQNATLSSPFFFASAITTFLSAFLFIGSPAPIIVDDDEESKLKQN